MIKPSGFGNIILAAVIAAAGLLFSYAVVAELADAQDLGSCAARCEGSTPFDRTTKCYGYLRISVIFCQRCDFFDADRLLFEIRYCILSIVTVRRFQQRTRYRYKNRKENCNDGKYEKNEHDEEAFVHDADAYDDRWRNAL